MTVRSLAAIAAILFLLGFAPDARAGTPSIPTCSHAELHAGSCVVPATGRLARIVDAGPSASDRCEADAPAEGSERVLCRYDGDA